LLVAARAGEESLGTLASVVISAMNLVGKSGLASCRQTTGGRDVSSDRPRIVRDCLSAYASSDRSKQNLSNDFVFFAKAFVNAHKR
jgi:hypothetical protein